MGGSSLGPDVLGVTFGRQSGWPCFHMLDSTDPAQIRAIERTVDLGKTLFIVSSKSGGTLEPNILMTYFFAGVGAMRGADQGRRTLRRGDRSGLLVGAGAPSSWLRPYFSWRASIGGRYSVLSKFGLVPAAAVGLDVKRLLETALPMVRACGPDVPPAENPGVQLGVAMGVAATRFGRDKVTIIASPGIADRRRLAGAASGREHRQAGTRADSRSPGSRSPRPSATAATGSSPSSSWTATADPAQQAAVAALERAGHPVVRIGVKDIWHIGQEFFRWEIATAVAGAIIGIDPFDQPDVEASKDKTRALTEDYEKSHSLPTEEPVFRENGLALYADPRNAAELGRHTTLSGYLKSHFARAPAAGDYVALLAYIERNEANTQALTAMRTGIRDQTHAATCVGFGPRFQHSTGQAYKGGPNSGVFLQITCDDPADIDVPGHAYSFGVVKAAQARGDLDVLVERGRRALRVHLRDVDAGLAELARAIDAALA